MKNVLICIPTIDYKMNCKLVITLQNIYTIFDKNNIDYLLSFKCGSLINRVRNEFITQFIEGNFTHLFFIDSDLFGFENLIQKFIDSDKDLIGGIYPKKSNKEGYNCNLKFCIEETLTNDISQVKHIPTGLMMIKKNVILNLIQSYPERHYKLNNKDYYNLFDSYVFNGVFLSEDYGFCNLYSIIGGKIYAVLDCIIVHVGICEYKGNFKKYLVKKISV